MFNEKQEKKTKKTAAGLRAVILAGGKGVRLHPFTVNFPKPLVPLDNTPIIEILIQRLLHSGITDITISLGHLAELIKAYFGHRRGLLERIKLRYVQENSPTGTAGSLKLISGLRKTFLVMNGDLLTDINLDDLVEFHFKKKAILTIATHKRDLKIDLGVLEYNDLSEITGYFEKPIKSYHVSMGIYVYEPRVLNFIEKGKYLDFPDLVLRLLDKKEKVCAFPNHSLWLDIGRPDDYAKAQALYSEKRERFENV